MTVVPRHRWTFLLRPKWLCWHGFAVLAIAGMLWLGDWQLRRAESGNELSWAYTVEWPLFAAFGLYFWARSIRDEVRQEAGQPRAPARVRPGEPGEPGEAGAPESPDAYADRLRAEVRGHGRWHGLR